MSRSARAVTRALGSAPAVALVGRLRPGLRVLTYHDVPDGSAFAAHVEEVVRRWQPVTGSQVADALGRGAELPARAVWVTFDDGDASIWDRARTVLVDHGVSATAFVCPGFLAGEARPWWDVVARASEAGMGAEVGGRRLHGGELVGALKAVDDDERRAVVRGLADRLDLPRPRPALDDLRRWIDAGLEVGNHTWDHPCLDRCEPEVQRDQVRRAHEWLVAHLPEAPRTFAYPNGNVARPARDEAVALGYEVVAGFDHRMVSRRRLRSGAQELSRLRIDADAPLQRFRAVVGGAHGEVLAARRRVLGR